MTQMFLGLLVPVVLIVLDSITDFIWVGTVVCHLLHAPVLRIAIPDARISELKHDDDRCGHETLLVRDLKQPLSGCLAPRR